MILVLAAALCVLSVPLTGGRISRLLDIQLRGTWLALAALALQVLITSVLPSGGDVAFEVAHLGSYGLAAAFIFMNRRIPGILILAFGAVLNVIAISFNHGVMPASLRATEIAGLPVEAGFANSAPVHDAKLIALGDIIPVPGPWPLGNVVSIGDVVIMAGLAVLLHRACRPRAAAPAVSGSLSLRTEA